MTKAYLDAAKVILRTGSRKPNRTGVDTLSAFAVPMQFDLREGFPLLTTKAIDWFHIVAENLWFLSGEPHIGFLKEHKIRFWDAWADERGNVPSAYGNFWRHFPVPDESNKYPITGTLTGYNDQIRWVLEELRRNPMSRRMVVSAWAPGNAQTSKLPPCHVMFALNVQNLRRRVPDGESHNLKTVEEPRLCLHLTQRSCDMFLGVPYNIAGYAFLCHVFAHLAGMEVGIFSHMLVDAHFYTSKPDGTMASGGTHGEDDNSLLDHIPLIMEQLTRTPRQLPKLTIDSSIKELSDFTRLLKAPRDEILDIFKLEGYDPHPAIKGKVAV